MVSTTETPAAGLRAFWTDLPREGRLLLSVVVVEFVGTGLVLPFWVVYLHEVRGFSLSVAGLLLAVQPLFGLLAVGPGGALIDRYGGRVVLTGSLVSVLAGQLVMSQASTVPLAALALALSGASFGVSFPASQSMIATVVPTGIRQRYFGVNFSLLNLGIGLGGLLGGAFVDVDRLWTFQTIYLVDAATYVPALVLLLGPLRHVAGRPVRQHGEAAPTYAEALRRPTVPTLTLLTFVGSFVAYAQLNTGLPAYARAVSQISTQALGVAFAANTLVIVLLQLVVLRRIEGRRRTRVVMVMAVVWAVSWLLLGASGLVPGTLGASVLVAACASVFALGETLLQPTLPAIVNDLATDRIRGRSNALNSAAFQTPMVLAPPFAGWMIAHDLQALYVAFLVVGCLAVVLVARYGLEPRLDATANGVGPRSSDLAPPAHGVETGPVRPTPTTGPEETLRS